MGGYSCVSVFALNQNHTKIEKKSAHNMVQVRRHGWVLGRYVCAVDSEVCSVTGFLFSQLMGEHWSYSIFIVHKPFRIIFFLGMSEIRNFIICSSSSRKQATRHCSLFNLLFFLQKKVDLHLFFAYLVFLHINRNPTFRTSRQTQKEFVKDTITCRLSLLSLYILCRPLFVWG